MTVDESTNKNEEAAATPENTTNPPYKSAENVDEGSDISDDATECTNDSWYQPRLKRVPKKVEFPGVVTRQEMSDKFDKVMHKMLKMSSTIKPEMRQAMKRACQRVAGERRKLTKLQIEKLVKELHLSEREEAYVFRKVYAKTMNVYRVLKI